nr:reverse transcriptase domain-containing protein [Tanacetum cinerariifolium]
EPPEVEIKDLPPHLEYAFLEGDDKLPVIISKDLSDEEKAALIKRRVNSKIHDVIEKEVLKLLDGRLIYPISDSPWDGVYALTIVEAKALPTNDAQVVCKFLKYLFARFGTPRAIISDRSTHFYNDQFVKVMLKYGITHRLAIAYHPQTSGKVEVSNRGLKRILERTIGKNHASWSNKLDDALWTFQKIKRIHDSKIKDRVFNVDDRVLLFNSILKIFSGKLKTCWTRPFTITKVFPYGTVELSQIDGPNFKVNGHRLMHYFGGDIPQMVVLDLQTFPKDQ